MAQDTEDNITIVRKVRKEKHYLEIGNEKEPNNIRREEKEE